MALKFEMSNKTLAVWAFFVAFMALIIGASKFGIIRPSYSAMAVEGIIALLLTATLLIEGVAEGKLKLDFGTYVIIGTAISLLVYGFIAVGMALAGTTIPSVWDPAVGVLFVIGFGATIYEMFAK